MFTFFSQFYQEYPTVCYLTLLLWIYFVLSELSNVFIDRNQFDSIPLPQKKSESSKISKESLCKRIAWINGKRALGKPDAVCSSFTFPFLLGSIKSLSNANINYISRFYVNTLYICTVPIECNRFTRSQLAQSAEYFVVSTPLAWHGFANKPVRMHFENTGHDGKLHAQIVWKNSFSFASSNVNRNIEKRKQQQQQRHRFNEYISVWFTYWHCVRWCTFCV